MGEREEEERREERREGKGRVSFWTRWRCSERDGDGLKEGADGSRWKTGRDGIET